MKEIGLVRSNARIRHVVVVPIVDALRCPVLLTGQLVPISRSEVTVIARTHAGILVVYASLIGIRSCGAARGDLAISYTFINASLLICRTLID